MKIFVVGRRHTESAAMLPMLIPSVCMWCFILLFCLSSPPSLHAQNESGVRKHNKAKVQLWGQWYDSTNAMYQHQFPIIRSIPPIASTMPVDILLSYVYLDSLLRFQTNRQIDKRMQAWKSLNDTLKWATSLLYSLTDYNPIIFSQYGIEAQINAAPRGGPKVVALGYEHIPDSVPAVGRYSADTRVIKNNVCEKMQQLYPTESDRMAVYSLLYSDYVLRVKVLAIDSMRDKYMPSPSAKVYRVTAQVIDTIKGKVYKHFPCYESYTEPSDKGQNGNRTQVAECPIIKFTSITGLYDGVGMVNPDEQQDPAFSQGNRRFMMSIGQEAIVFLGLINPLIDFEFDYFDCGLLPNCSLNALPVIDGNVRDINHYWGNQTLRSYQDWKNKAQELISAIKNRSY